MVDLAGTRSVVGAREVADPGRPRDRGRRAVFAVLGVLPVAAVVVALVLAGSAPQASPDGLPDAGRVAGWAAPVLRVGLDVAAVGAVGSLLTAVFLLPCHAGPSGRRALRAAARWAAVWSAAAVGLFVVSTAQALGVPLSSLLRAPGQLSYGLDLPDGRAHAALAIAALWIALNARGVTTRLGGRALLVLALAALFPLLLTGHAAASEDHYLATQALVVHVLGATLWLGGLLSLVLLVRDPSDLRVAVPRFSVAALACFVAVGVSGVAAALLQLGLSTASLTSPYGLLVVTKAGALLLLGTAGWLHRRRTLPALRAGRPGAFLRLAVVEMAVMAGAVGIAVALSRTPPPVNGVAAAATTHGGAATELRNLPPLDVAELLTQWRPDAVVVTALVVASGAYLRGVRVLRSRGTTWSRWRTASMLAGLGLTFMVLCSGVASYASALLSVQSAQVLTMAMTVPVLITGARPVLLARLCDGLPATASGTGRGRMLADPVNGLAALLGVIAVLYATPLLGLSLREPGAQLLVNVAAMAGGFLFFWPLLGLDWLPTQRSVGDRFLLSAFAVLLSIAVVVVLARSGSTFERSWFGDLNLWWGDQGSDRRWTALVVSAHIALLVSVTAWLGLTGRTDRVQVRVGD